MKIFGKNITKRKHAEYYNGEIEIKPSEYFWGNIKLPQKLGNWLWDRF